MKEKKPFPKDAKWAALCALLGGVVLYGQFSRESAVDEMGLLIGILWLLAAAYYGVRAVRGRREEPDRPENTLRDR